MTCKLLSYMDANYWLDKHREKKESRDDQPKKL
jgi:hypothetical protein